MYQLGLSSCGYPITEEMFRAYQESGIANIEISFGIKEEVTENLDCAKISALSKQYGVNLWSYHLPFGHFNVLDISSCNPEVQKDSIQYLSDLIKRVSDIGIDKYIIHPSGEPIEDAERPERMKRAKESLAELAKVAAACGGTIAVEDLPRTCLGNCSDDMLDLLSADESLRACFDTNHLLGEDIVEFIRKVGKKFITTHVSDYDFKNERHWLPGEGKINWTAVLDALQEVGYQGLWLYEISMTTPDSILRERVLTHADFVKNANELFSGKPLTVFGTPKPNLPSWK